jgi:phospholipid/cholesterol/gamma-HCH transport system ATP-binding protein
MLIPPLNQILGLTIMIEVMNLYKGFNGNKVLKGLHLEVPDRQTLVILGPSGQGKTVLIKTMVRLLQPDCGHVLYDGADIFSMKKKAFTALQQKIAFVFQNSALFDFINVEENLRLYLKMHGKLTEGKIKEQLEEILHLVGLEETVLRKYPEELSGGMKKRVALARAMTKQPAYIFYDEPTTGLDKGNARKISDLMVMLQQKFSVTSIIVTHDIKLMEEVADRVALLKQGNIEFSGPAREISPQMLQYLYEQGADHDS